jgi:hypothetical protein
MMGLPTGAVAPAAGPDVGKFAVPAFELELTPPQPASEKARAKERDPKTRLFVVTIAFSET